MNKVYIVQENHRFSYDDAEQYGELCFMTRLEFSSNANSLNNQTIQEQIYTNAQQFEVDDYLLLTGNPVSMAFAFHLVAMKLASGGHKSIRVLKWDNMVGKYVSIEINIA